MAQASTSLHATECKHFSFTRKTKQLDYFMFFPRTRKQLSINRWDVISLAERLFINTQKSTITHTKSDRHKQPTTKCDITPTLNDLCQVRSRIRSQRNAEMTSVQQAVGGDRE